MQNIEEEEMNKKAIMRLLIARPSNKIAIMHKPVEDRTSQIEVKYSLHNHLFKL